MWTRGLDWDDEIDKDLARKIEQWFAELDGITQVQVQRCLRSKKDPSTMTVHTFVDASKDALGAVCYARSACEDGAVETRLIASKTKVAPLATMSTPRLELSTAVIRLRLTQTVSKVLETALSTATFWCDSTNTLWWIRGNDRAFKLSLQTVSGKFKHLQNLSTGDMYPPA